LFLLLQLVFTFTSTMNLFILSLLPKEIAEAMMDKHVSKILLEAVQMLCTAKRVLDPDAPENEQLYKLAHKNHPVTIWCRTSRANFVWTLDLIDALHSEWRFRYGHPETKVHKSYLVAQILRATIPDASAFLLPCCDRITPFALAMPDAYKSPDGDPVASYRAYYMSPEKQKIATWSKARGPPEWFKSYSEAVPGTT
jgi:hypothetical protein